MIVMKFGGSSLANTEKIRNVASIVEAYRCENPVLVLSAIGKTTDNLIESGQRALAGLVDCHEVTCLHAAIVSDLGLPECGVNELLDELVVLLRSISVSKELDLKTLDYLLSFGERLSVRTFCSFLCQQGVQAIPIDAWNLGFVTTSNFSNAEILSQTYENIPVALATLTPFLPVVTGFIAKDLNGAITTLGRGGSDLTASVIGAALGVREIQVWKEVPGVLTVDPQVLSTALPIQFLSFEEASDLAYFGAKVLHPMSIVPAMKKNIPVRVKNSGDRFHPGTLISSEGTGLRSVTSIAYRQNLRLVRLVSDRSVNQVEFFSTLFRILAEHNIRADLFSASAEAITLSVSKNEWIVEVENCLKGLGNLSIRHDITIISVVAQSCCLTSIVEQSLKVLSEEGIEVWLVSYGASKTSVCLAVDDSEAIRSCLVLHKHFFT